MSYSYRDEGRPQRVADRNAVVIPNPDAEGSKMALHRAIASFREKVIVLPTAMDWSLTCGRTEIKLIPVVVSGRRHEPRVPSPLP
jgi:hypothetical protein